MFALLFTSISGLDALCFSFHDVLSFLIWHHPNHVIKTRYELLPYCKRFVSPENNSKTPRLKILFRTPGSQFKCLWVQFKRSLSFHFSLLSPTRVFRRRNGNSHRRCRPKTGLFAEIVVHGSLGTRLGPIRHRPGRLYKLNGHSAVGVVGIGQDADENECHKHGPQP